MELQVPKLGKGGILRLDDYRQYDAPSYVASELEQFAWNWLVGLLSDTKRLDNAFEKMRAEQQNDEFFFYRERRTLPGGE